MKTLTAYRKQLTATCKKACISALSSKPDVVSPLKGFTLIETVVAVGLFAVVMLVSMATLLSLIDASRKARALESVMDNLGVALDGMVRTMRMGSSYHCGTGDVTIPTDCGSSPQTSIAFLRFGGSPGNANDYWVYSYNAVTKRLERSENGGVDTFAVTAPEISIDSMQFYVVGSSSGDDVQPKILVVIKGTAGASNVKTRTTFSIQATAIQRALDL